jgi:hypothetical protein
MIARVPNPKPVPCPKCNRLLKPSGQLSAGEGSAPVYQCDECLVTQDFLGEPTEMALTFCVDENGRLFDPADPDGELKF